MSSRAVINNLYFFLLNFSFKEYKKEKKIEKENLMIGETMACRNLKNNNLNI